MTIPLTFSKYLAGLFLFWISIVSTAFLSIIYLFEAIEILRRSLSKLDVTFSLALKMALLKVPAVFELLLPLIMLFSLFLVFRKLQKNLELIIAFASGFSLYQLLVPFISIGIAISILDLFILNPISASFSARYESLNLKYLKKQESQLILSDTGLWLRQENEDKNGYTLIRSEKIDISSHSFFNVTFYVFENNDVFTERFDAQKAQINPGYWELEKVFQHKSGQKTIFLPSQVVPSSFSFEGIEDHFLPPPSLSFWRLPYFIKNLEKAGFSGTAHLIYWYSLLFRPISIIGMILVATCFGIQWKRTGKQIKTFAGTFLSGFLFYLFNDIMQTLSGSHVLPYLLGMALSPCLLIILSFIYLLHLNHLER